MINKKISFILICCLFVTKISQAIEPDVFVQSTVNRASQTLSKEISKEKKMFELQELAKETVDIKGIGLYTLGKFRKEISDEQKIKYSKLFENYFLKSFSSRLSEYSNPKINVISKEKKNDKYTIVSSILVATKDRPEIKIDWRIYTLDPQKPLIRDLVIEGLSLARTQKEEFASIIKSNDNSIDALFESLEKFVNE
ncbi:ABC transporter substrate-binding protein [Candidatus Pelagibacter sp.]|nr:ABC transporter substrate-binding protein [Candidatus Pelagibacter sp.]